MDNHGNSTDDATTAIGALVAVLATLSVVLRFYSRHATGAGLRWDDWLVLLALVATIATDALVLFASSIDPNGAEAASNTDPSYEYTPADVEYTRLSFIATVLYFTITSATKLSILLMYRRLFWINASFRLQIHVAAFVVVGFWIGTTVADLLNCIPIQWTWINSFDDPRYCFNYTVFWLASGIVEAVIDVVILLIPVRMVLKLQLNKSKKIAIAGVFLLGAFVILSGIVKVILSYVPGNREPSFNRTEVWTTVHTGTGILCACLPVCWPQFVRLAKLGRSRWSSIPSIRKLRYGVSGWTSMDRAGMRDVEGDMNSPERGYELPVRPTGSGASLVPPGHNSEERQIQQQQSLLEDPSKRVFTTRQTPIGLSNS
ncbi:hypothetical protein F5Y19DRAFT_476469 [Xylariaceae sp. FL1651]|nr:hypothetical protein F5Y19DRAFT_476469 [Xylariaceae sp. FL1651]